MIDYYIKALLIMVVLFAFILPGYLLRKAKMISVDVLPALSNILLYVCQPIMFIKAFAVDPIEPTWGTIRNMIVVFSLSFAGMVAVYFLSRLVFGRCKDRKQGDIYTFIGVFSNCGFCGIPFVDMLTGGNSLALMYLIVFNCSFNFLVWTLGVYLMTQDKKYVSVKKALFNPSTAGLAIGLLLFLIPPINIFNIEAISPIRQIVTYLSEMTAPLSMIIVGVRGAELSVKEIFCHPTDYLASAMRLIVAPFIMLAIVLPFAKTALLGEDVYVYLAPVIAMAMTPASTAVAYAEKFGGDKLTATRTFLSGTLLGVATIPLIITFALWVL
jgi:hypothetical protein